MDTSQTRMNPREIVIKRENRQRQENIADVEDLKQSITALRNGSPGSGGLIHPIVVRNDEDGSVVLVAGERRLTSFLQLDLPDIPVRFFENLSPTEAEIIELEENVKRKEMTWRDQVRAVGRIHTLYKKQKPGWTIEQTSSGISLHHSHVRKILHVYEALDSGRVNKAESIEQAYNTLHRFAERKAETIVNDLIVKGAEIFGNMSANVTTPTNGASHPAATMNEDFVTVNAISVAPSKPTDLTAEGAIGSEIIIHGIEDISDLPDDLWATIKTDAVLETKPLPPSDPVINANFAEWIKTYTGPKFTLIHCDFPYGNYRGGDSRGSLSSLETDDFYDNTTSVYWNLVDTLTANLDRIMSYSAHLVFWFNMNFYTETVAKLRKTGLMVHDHPLIWHKTGGPGGLGVVPGTAVTYPRRTYDTALIAVRGNRPLAKPGMNSYAAPTAGNKIHPSQKPEPMLRFFLQMFVDETTTMLDPTCGSAAALRAAEDLGAKSILGLELDPNYASEANTMTLKARILRNAGALRKEA